MALTKVLLKLLSCSALQALAETVEASTVKLPLASLVSTDLVKLPPPVKLPVPELPVTPVQTTPTVAIASIEPVEPADPLDAPSASVLPETIPLYNCFIEESMWETAWTPDWKKWCCEHEAPRGCEQKKETSPTESLPIRPSAEETAAEFVKEITYAETNQDHKNPKVSSKKQNKTDPVVTESDKGKKTDEKRQDEMTSEEANTITSSSKVKTADRKETNDDVQKQTVPENPGDDKKMGEEKATKPITEEAAEDKKKGKETDTKPVTEETAEESTSPNEEKNAKDVPEIKPSAKDGLHGKSESQPASTEEKMKHTDSKEQKLAGCDAECEVDGLSSPCEKRIRWAAANLMEKQDSPCEAAHVLVVTQCKSCGNCQKESVCRAEVKVEALSQEFSPSLRKTRSSFPHVGIVICTGVSATFVTILSMAIILRRRTSTFQRTYGSVIDEQGSNGEE